MGSKALHSRLLVDVKPDESVHVSEINYNIVLDWGEGVGAPGYTKLGAVVLRLAEDLERTDENFVKNGERENCSFSDVRSSWCWTRS